MQRVNSVIEPLVLSLVKDNPDNHIDYMVEYMERNFGDQALNGDKQEAVVLQAKIAELEEKLEKQKAASGQDMAEESKAEALNSEDETDPDDDDDYIDDLPEAKPAAKRGPRASVSAEAFGVWN